MTGLFGESGSGWDTGYDDGLTRERTLWAWHRTGLAFGVNGLLLANGFRQSTVSAVGYVLAAAAIALGIVAYSMGEFRFKRRFWRKRIGRARDRAFRTISMASTAIAVATIVLIALEA